MYRLSGILLSYLLMLSICTQTLAQNGERCGTMLYSQYLLKKYPQLADLRKQSQFDVQHIQRNATIQSVTSTVNTIPVVVHVVYNTPQQNISDAQIQSQIDALNRDYRKLNTDTNLIPGVWKPIAADAGLEFCLAKKDPVGNDTNGITRTYTTVTQFGYDDQVKSTSNNGQDGWDPHKYLNLWVCNLGTSLYGFAQFPTDLSTSPSTDGVVINYTAFGTMGTAISPTNGGRTCSHEVGHWLNLYHIWGDDGGACTGDDFISDTPNQANANYGCKLSFPSTDACSTVSPGIMFMNYMDYGDDPCILMFTQGQAARILNAINTYRASILSTTICTGPSYIGIAENYLPVVFSVYPNPATDGMLNVSSPLPLKSISVFNVLGENIYCNTLNQIQAKPIAINLAEQNAGIYFIKILTAKGYSSQKVIITH